MTYRRKLCLVQAMCFVAATCSLSASTDAKLPQATKPKQASQMTPLKWDSVLFGRVEPGDWTLRSYLTWIPIVRGHIQGQESHFPKGSASQDVYCFRLKARPGSKATLTFSATGYENEERKDLLLDPYASAIQPLVKLSAKGRRSIAKLANDIDLEARIAEDSNQADVFWFNMEYNRHVFAQNPDEVQQFLSMLQQAVANHPSLSASKFSQQRSAYASIIAAVEEPKGADSLEPKQIEAMVAVARESGISSGTSEGVRAFAILALSSANLEGRPREDFLKLIRAYAHNPASNLFRVSRAALAKVGTDEEKQRIKVEILSKESALAVASAVACLNAHIGSPEEMRKVLAQINGDLVYLSDRPNWENHAKMWHNPKANSDMIYVEAGQYRIGSNQDNPTDNPEHDVTLGNYYIDSKLVTVKQYRTFVEQNPDHTMPKPPNEYDPNWEQDDNPIVNVTWDDAMAYCKWAGGRLPTEAQWEVAAKGRRGGRFPWGDKFDSTKLQCSTGGKGNAINTNPMKKGTSRVNNYPPNDLGLYDMAGNVEQWCSDWYDTSAMSSLVKDSTKHPDPQGPDRGMTKVMRGGGWIKAWNIDTIGEGYFTTTGRNSRAPYLEDFDAGFRCVISQKGH